MKKVKNDGRVKQRKELGIRFKDMNNDVFIGIYVKLWYNIVQQDILVFFLSVGNKILTITTIVGGTNYVRKGKVYVQSQLQAH